MRSEFSWELLQFMLEGRSSLDLPQLQIHNEKEAFLFAQNYGYDLEDPVQRWILYGRCTLKH